MRQHRPLSNIKTKCMSKVENVFELTNYESWQLEKYHNILPTVQCTPDGELFETGIAEIERLAEWMNMQAETQLSKTY